MPYFSFLTFLLILACGPTNPSRFAEQAGEDRVLEAMFHPFDPTLEEIAGIIRGEGHKHIDIAMYSMESSDKSPIIAALGDPEVQHRIRERDLQVRMIFEGYDGRDQVSEEFEELGIDVRHFSSSRKVHHKFGVFGGNSDHPVVVTGSANWSLSSYRRYNENILFVRGDLALANQYQHEFNKLWDATDKFGVDFNYAKNLPASRMPIGDDLHAVFNSENFKFSSGNISLPRRNRKKSTLTRTLVREIDRAEESILMATTRINLRPVYDALLRAIERGVEVKIITNQDQYAIPYVREKEWKLKGCEVGTDDKDLLACCAKVDSGLIYDAYEPACSRSQIHGYFLAQKSEQGEVEGLSVRVKLWTLSPGPRNSITDQMHAKYTIVDERRVISGSFNYSHSSEYNHIENMVIFNGEAFPRVLARFVENFDTVYRQGRDDFYATDDGFRDRFETAHRSKTKTVCDLGKVALTYPEIDHLLATRQRHKRWSSLRDACFR